MHDHEYPTQCITAQRDKTLLPSGVRVFDGESHRITKRLLRVSEADAALAEIRFGFGRIELDGYAQLCILYAYMQVTNYARVGSK